MKKEELKAVDTLKDDNNLMVNVAVDNLVDEKIRLKDEIDDLKYEKRMLLNMLEDLREIAHKGYNTIRLRDNYDDNNVRDAYNLGYESGGEDAYVRIIKYINMPK